MGKTQMVSYLRLYDIGLDGRIVLNWLLKKQISA
jgi:hypothetical protein